MLVEIDKEVLVTQLAADPTLRDFAQSFYKHLLDNNLHTETPNLHRQSYGVEIPSAHRRLDAVARLLVGADVCAAVFIIDNQFFIATNHNNHSYSSNYDIDGANLTERVRLLFSYLQGAARFRKDTAGITSYYDGVQYGREDMLIHAFLPYLRYQYDRDKKLDINQLKSFLKEALSSFTDYQKRPPDAIDNMTNDVVDSWGYFF